MKAKPIIFTPQKNSGRIKFYIPYQRVDLRNSVKRMNSSYWHPQQKLWSILNTKENLHLLKHVLEDYDEKELNTSSPVKKRELDEQSFIYLDRLERALVLKHYSSSTIKNYKNVFEVFLSKFITRNIDELSKDAIEDFIYELIKKHNISTSYQNMMINAIKAYYELVLKKPKEYYEIERPRRERNIPNVLSKEEVFAIINSPNNIKHRAILWTIYSAGLRISEVINLRIRDIHSDSGYIFIKDSKGKKDRKTILSPYLITLLRNYYKKYRPAYWLFEGQSGEKYSKSSITSIFRKAVEQTNSNPWATVHTLRHSFATHCIEDNINLRYIQNMLGHNSPKTTEIYTKTIEINNKKINSPLDNLIKNSNLPHK